MFTISMLPKRLIIAAAAVVVVLFAFVLFSGTRVEIKFPRPVAAVGTATPVSVETDSAHGVKTFTAVLEQDGQRQAIYEDKIKSPQKNRVYTFTAGTKQAAL